ncbi:MAG: tetratricopeptide repeat protein [Porphyrobacter sp.]|nr:tetratricopeptide repeat protein [Porphyrobacter sp.]
MTIAGLLVLWIAALLPMPAAATPAADSVASAPVTAARAAFDRAVEEAKSAIMTDPEAALARSDVALQRAAALPGREGAIGRATALWLKVEASIGLHRPAEAKALLEAALPLVERHAPRTKLHGDLMRARGGTAALDNDLQGALRAYLEAYRIFRAAGEKRSQALALRDIGELYWQAGDYRRMLRYYEQSHELYDEDPFLSLTSHNNRGEALRKLGRRQEAEQEFRAALANARALDSSLLEMRILNNLALIEAELGRFADAQRDAARALRLGAGSDAAAWRPYVYGTLGKIAAARGDGDRAAAFFDRAFAGADLARTDSLYMEIHEAAARLYDQRGDARRALAHLKAFARLEGEARDLTASVSSQLLAARFDYANQNLRIAQLKQGQLERDVKIERQRVRFRTTLFSGLAVAGAILLALVTVAFLSIRRSRNEVRAANAVLTEVNLELEKALKAKTEFLAMTSHEIRTPLNGILGMTQVMLANPQLGSQAREQVQLVQGAGQTMRALVDDILDVAKMETGEVTVSLEPTRLRPILEDAVALWAGEAAAKGLALEADLAELPEWVETDGDRVRQIVFNLLSNAIKFTPAGHVRLTAHCDRAAGQLALAVEDSGIGIAADEQARVFDAFHQVDSAMTRQFSGTGLGLAICRNLAAALGGSIALASVPGEGSRFTVTLPLREVEQPAPPARAVTLAQATVAALDGNEMKRAMIKGLIEPHVHRVLDAGGGAAALDLLARDGVDALLIDAASVAPAEADLATDRLGPLAALLGAAAERQVATIVLLAPDGALPLDAVAALSPTALLLKPAKGGDLLRALRAAFGPAEEAAPLQQVA